MEQQKQRSIFGDVISSALLIYLLASAVGAAFVVVDMMEIGLEEAGVPRWAWLYFFSCMAVTVVAWLSSSRKERLPGWFFPLAYFLAPGFYLIVGATAPVVPKVTGGTPFVHASTNLNSLVRWIVVIVVPSLVTLTCCATAVLNVRRVVKAWLHKRAQARGAL